MRGVFAPFLAVALLVASCGGDDSSSSPTTEPRVPATTSAPVTTGTQAPPSTGAASASTMPAVPTTQGEVPPTTEAPPPTTSVDQVGTELAVLRPGGLGEVDFGTPADEAIAELTTLLGPPDRVDALEPIGEGGDECVEGASWLDCLRDLRVVEEGRLATWGTYGLEIALVDTRIGGWPPEQTSLQFGDWHATIPTGQTRLVTEEGLRPGMTVGEVRRAGSDIEFGYNEGSLDSFSVTFGEHGGYWGRLDWNPDTDVIEGWDVSAVQTALNEHGASLVVDGEWGPLSEAAWLRFLTDHGFEAFTSQLWLTPEIGAALGLPPDDITVATLEPRPATDAIAVPLPILRADGIGPHDFGTDMSVVTSWATDLLGEPATARTPEDSASGPVVASVVPNLMYICGEQTAARWEIAALDLYFAQWEIDDDGLVSCAGPVRLVAWGVGSYRGVDTPRDASSPRLTTEEGIGVGTTVVELIELGATPAFMRWSDTGLGGDVGMFPAGFYLGDPAPREHVFGLLAWDWVRDLQAALNHHGAQLAVDGEAGPLTIAALEEYRVERQLPSIEQAILHLALEPEGDIQVVSMAAGNWPLEFECGVLGVGWRPC